MKLPEKTHPLIQLLQIHEEAVISALAATPDVSQRAEAITGYNFGGPGITLEQEEAICVSREEIATNIFASLLGYLPLDL